MKVRKRDGRLVNFNESKIVDAIKLASDNMKTDNKITDEQLKNTVSFVKSSLESEGKEEIEVDDIHDLVEKYLKKENKDVAKSYIDYRKSRELERFKNLDITKKIFEKLNATNVVNQNANVDEFSFGGRKGEADSVLMKELALNYLISPKFAKNHNNNRIYIHDLDSYFVGMHNCLSLPIDDLLKNGMKTRQVFIRPANSLSTAMQLVAVAIQLQSLQQFGGVAVTHIDWSMIPYIRKSFFKHYNEGLKFIKNKKPITLSNVETISILDRKIYKNKKVQNYAYEMIKKEIHQSVEGLLHNLNSLQSRSGNQLPFSSINYGTCTLEEGRLLIKEILKCTIDGVGNHATSIFPCQIFQLMDGVNAKENDPNYDLFKLAIECTSKRLYPNYVNCDWSNDQGYNKDDPRTYPSTMGAVRGDEFVSIKINGVEFNNISIKKAIETIDSYTSNIEWINNKSNKIGYTKYKQVKNCQIKCQNKWVDILNIEFNDESSPLKLYEVIFDKNGENQILHITEDHPLHTARGRIIATDLKVGDVIYDSVSGYGYKIISVKVTDEKCNTYDFTTETDMFDLSGIVSHNCRTYSSTDINAESEELSHLKDGRGNIAPATIVLPTIAMESKKKMKDEVNEDKLIELFMKNLDDAITDCKDELIERFNYICSQNPKSASFMYENRTFYGYNENEGIRSALKHGTLAIGQIGLAETLQILIGTDQCTDKGMELAKKIESLFKQRCAEFKKEWHCPKFTNEEIYDKIIENLTKENVEFSKEEIFEFCKKQNRF